MIQALIGPIAELAGGWLKGKADANAAAANLKLVEAEAKATIMTWKDEWLTILFSVPLILCFLPFEWAEQAVQNGFAALESMPDWYQYTLGVIVAASFGVRSATKFFGSKK
jgi:hypothetical protein